MSPMEISHFLILQPLSFNHSWCCVTGYELHIKLGRFDISVAKQSLNTSNINAAHDPLRGSKMTQVVKTNPI